MNNASNLPEGVTLLPVDCGEFTVTLGVEGRTNILAIKRAMEEEMGIEVARQILSPASDFSHVFPDHHSLVVRGHVLFFRARPLPLGTKIKVTVSHLSSLYQQDFEVEETDTVMSLKQKIRATSEFNFMIAFNLGHKKPESIVAEDLRLIRRFNVLLSNDHLPLSEYYIHEGCKINMHISVIQASDLNWNATVESEQDSCSTSGSTAESRTN